MVRWSFTNLKSRWWVCVPVSIYGSYTGLVYLTPLIGGYIADKYWGIRRSVFWGAMMMAVGQFLMFQPVNGCSRCA